MANARATHSAAIYATDGLDIYFQSQRAGIDGALAARLAAFIAATQTSLDCAVYDLRHPEILAALASVAKRGKSLRIAYDASKEHVGGLMGDPKPGGTEQALADADLLRFATPIHHGRHLMHDKFLVRDGRSLWTGSANLTVGGLTLQDNNCLALDSQALAADYSAVFESLLSGEHAGARAGHQTQVVGGARITPLFAPAGGEGLEQTIIAALRGAKRVRVLAFLVSDPGILAALAPLGADPAADIRGIYDPHGMEDVLRYSQQDPSRFWFLRDPRFVAAPSEPFNPSREQNFMHNKVLILDDRLVLTGSYNLSENAEANDENLVVIESSEVAAAYTAYFDALDATYRQAHGGTPHGTSHVRRGQEGSSMSSFVSGPRAQFLEWRTRPGQSAARLTLVQSAQTLKGETQAGQTQHFIVYSDGTPTGDASAKAVLASAEADYAAVADWFGGINLPQGQEGDDQNTPRTALPLQVAMDAQAGGAYHYGCNATDLYIEPDPNAATGLVVAELVEVFEAAINNGWDCGRTNGEALSRVLAVERNGNLAPIIVPTAQSWWANGHQDYISTNDADDTSEDANGCGTLFLYYVHSQLGFSWKQIVAAGGTTLGATYQKLAGNAPSPGFADFVSRLATLDSGGQLNVTAANPFPIGSTATPPAAQPPAGQPQPPAQPPILPDIPGVTTPGGGIGAGVIVALVVLIVLVLLAIGAVATGAIHL